MREILFRAKRTDTGEWAEGFFTCAADCCGRSYFIDVPRIDPDDSNHRYDIDPKTVGQFTGMYDSNDIKIYEGDIIVFPQNLSRSHIMYEVRFDDGGFGIFTEDSFIEELFRNDAVVCEVVGNIYDNVKLLGGDKKETVP